MRSNGSAFPGNPAWQMISGMAHIFIWIWVLLLGGGVIGIQIAIFSDVLDHLHEKDQLKKQEASDDWNEAMKTKEREFRAKQLEQEKKNRLKQEKIRKIERERVREELRLREIERRKMRSHADAIDEAMDDFG